MSTATYQLSSAITDRLLRFAEGAAVGDEFDLDTIDEVSWDELTLFGDGTDQAEINRIVGQPLFSDPDGRIWTPTALVVFRSDGEITHAVMLPPPLNVLGVAGHWYGRGSSVIASDVGTPPWLVLADHRGGD